MSCGSQCFVSLPHDAVGCSAMCDGIKPEHTHLLFGVKVNAVCFDVHLACEVFCFVYLFCFWL